MISSQCLFRSDPSDLAHDRQIALGGKPNDVTWCDRYVIDDSRRLDPALAPGSLHHPRKLLLKLKLLRPKRVTARDLA